MMQKNSLTQDQKLARIDARLEQLENEAQRANEAIAIDPAAFDAALSAVRATEIVRLQRAREAVLRGEL